MLTQSTAVLPCTHPLVSEQGRGQDLEQEQATAPLVLERDLDVDLVSLLPLLAMQNNSLPASTQGRCRRHQMSKL